MKINFKKLSDTAIAPKKGHYNDSGFDLYADEDATLAYGETKVIATNIALELPDGYMADVRPRSGLTRDTALRVQYGTVDAGYRGNIGIICDNVDNLYKVKTIDNKLHAIITGDQDAILTYNTAIEIKRGDKIAQLVIQRIPDITLIEATGLNDSARGANGFGSTDLKEVEG